jgi:PelA/Pel-15E family pectate lyase
VSLSKNSITQPKISSQWIKIFTVLILFNLDNSAQVKNSVDQEIFKTISKATKFMDEKVSIDGGYVWYYKTDFTRRWGEMEAFSTMAWAQGAGLVPMGNIFLDIYEATGDEYYYRLAGKTVSALILGQLECGGWNYIIDYAGEASLKKWYDTIGKNGWRLEEFREYLGNATFDDDVSEGSASLLLKMYLTKKEIKYKPALDKAINFILKSQYKAGGWPQRFPKANIEYKNSPFAYSNDYTFNDGVTWNNLTFLVKCYYLFGNSKFVNPIKRAMNFFLLTQQANPQAGWSQQYTMDLKPDSARSYEPKCLDPVYTANHLEMLMKFYKMTGNKKYIARIQDGIDWLKSVMLSHTGDTGDIIVPKFVEIGTNRSMFLHRTGENSKYGKYFVNYDMSNIVVHYKSTREVFLRTLENEFNEIKKQEISRQKYKPFNILSYNENENPVTNLELIDEYLSIVSEREFRIRNIDEAVVQKIISELDEQGRWLTENVFMSNPYIGEVSSGNTESIKYMTTRVGNLFDTSPFENPTKEKYISTGEYIKNVSILLKYLKKMKEF